MSVPGTDDVMLKGGIVEMEFLENQSRRKTQSDFDRVVKLTTPRIQNSFL